MNEDNWCIFISHASENKDFVDKLMRELRKSITNELWYDKEKILLGDDIHRKVFEDGLERTRYGIVVFSNEFFVKTTPMMEFGILFYRMRKRLSKVIPIYYKLTKEDVILKLASYTNYLGYFTNELKDNNSDEFAAVSVFKRTQIKATASKISLDIMHNENRLYREKIEQRIGTEGQAEDAEVVEVIEKPKKPKWKTIELFLEALVLLVLIFLATRWLISEPSSTTNGENAQNNITVIAQKHFVLGKIEDIEGNPVSHATVEILKTTNTFTRTDSYGNFRVDITGVKSNTLTFKVSHPEYDPIELIQQVEFPEGQYEFHIGTLVLKKAIKPIKSEKKQEDQGLKYFNNFLGPVGGVMNGDHNTQNNNFSNEDDSLN